MLFYEKGCTGYVGYKNNVSRRVFFANITSNYNQKYASLNGFDKIRGLQPRLFASLLDLLVELSCFTFINTKPLFVCSTQTQAINLNENKN